MYHIPQQKYNFKIILLQQQLHLYWWEDTDVSVKVSLSAVLGGQ
jgi:hypothetical protein